MPVPITAEMTINDITERYPQASPVLSEAGIGCGCCGASQMETLADGLRSHGMDDGAIESVVKKLNEATARKPEAEKTGGKVILITESAIRKAKELMTKEGKAGWGLRVGVLPGGCSGFTYELTFDSKEQLDDTVIVEDGLKIFVDTESAALLAGAKVDFVDGLQGSGFKVENPNAHSTCGCGKNFG